MAANNGKTKPEGKVLIQALVSLEQYKKVREIADREERSMSSVLVLALSEYLKKV